MAKIVSHAIRYNNLRQKLCYLANVFVKFENLCHEVVDVVLEIVYPCSHIINSGYDLVRHGLKPGRDTSQPEKK